MAQSTCTIHGCTNPHIARGWCTKHYARWNRFGDPESRTKGEVREGKKICSKCKLDTPLDQYSPGASACRRCLAAIKRHKPKAAIVPQPPMYCVECGTVFVPEMRQMITCSAACAASRKKRFDRDLMTERGRDEANASSRRWYAANREAAYTTKARYRARKAAAFVEDVDRRVVFARDNWVCQLCFERVDPDARYPAAKTPSLDHRIPLSRGGKHSYKNAQTACLACNSRKGNRLT